MRIVRSRVRQNAGIVETRVLGERGYGIISLAIRVGRYFGWLRDS